MMYFNSEAYQFMGKSALTSQWWEYLQCMQSQPALMLLIISELDWLGLAWETTYHDSASSLWAEEIRRFSKFLKYSSTSKACIRVWQAAGPLDYQT